MATNHGRGTVVFVGAGPGDPELLTLGAVAALNQADLVLCDTSALREVLQHPAIALPGTAEVRSVDEVEAAGGKDSRLELVGRVAGAGRTVVRLVAGDPFLDGRVAAEAAACVRAGFALEVIPGVSSLTAVPEYAGVSLDTAAGVQFVAWPPDAETAASAPQFSSIGTVVVSARAGQAAALQESALAAGRPAAAPVLVTFRGGSTSQTSVVTRLGELGFSVGSVDAESHVHVMIGEAVEDGEREALDWFESKPLFGWRVLVPRTKDSVAVMTARLHGYGARYDEVPTISVERPRTPQQMDKAVRGLVEGRYEWVIFTSTNAVRAVREKFDEYGLDARSFSGLKVAAAGLPTAAALRSWGIEPDLVPEGEQSAAGLAAEFPEFDPDFDPINRVFLPRADIATETLSEAVTKLGWEVEDVTAYRTVRAAPPPAVTREDIKTGRFDAVVFSSSSTVRNLVGIAGKPHPSTVVAVIGPATATTCEEHGLRVDVMAETPSVAALADALADFAAKRREGMMAAGKPITKPSQRRTRRSS